MIELIVTFMMVLPNNQTATQVITETLKPNVMMSDCKYEIINDTIKNNPDSKFRKMISIACKETHKT